MELENSVGALKSQRRRLGAGLVGSQHTAPEIQKRTDMADGADMADVLNMADVVDMADYEDMKVETHSSRQRKISRYGKCIVYVKSPKEKNV